jgi:HSP20 family molecular chaperone IbpA
MRRNSHGPGNFCGDRSPEREGLQSPTVEVEERDGVLYVRADLPGLTNDDVKVDVTGDAGTKAEAWRT